MLKRTMNFNITNKKISEISFFLMLILAAITGIVNLFTKSAIFTEAIPAVFLLISLFFCLFSIYRVKFKKSFILSFLFWIIFLFVTISLINIIIYQDPMRLFGIYSYALFFLVSFCAYQIIKNNPSLFKKLLFVLASLVIFSCLMSILERLFGADFFLQPTINWPRTQGALRTTLGFSGFLGTTTFISLVFIKTYIRNWLICGSIFILILSGAFFSGSRMLTLIYIIIILIVWPLFWLLIYKRNAISKTIIYYLKIILLLFFIVFILGINFFQFHQVSTIFDSSDLANQLRYAAWKDTIKYVFGGIVPFLFGTGFGVSGSGLNYFGGCIIGTESYVLKTYVEMGFILATLFWLAIAFFLFKKLIQNLPLLRSGQALPILYCGVIIGLLIGLFQNIVQMTLETPSSAIWFWTLFGASLAFSYKQNSSQLVSNEKSAH